MFEIFLTPPRCNQEYLVEYEADNIDDLDITGVYINVDNIRGCYTEVDVTGLLVDTGLHALYPKTELLTDWFRSQCEQDYIDYLADKAEYQVEYWREAQQLKNDVKL